MICIHLRGESEIDIDAEAKKTQRNSSKDKGSENRVAIYESF